MDFTDLPIEWGKLPRDPVTDNVDFSKLPANFWKVEITHKPKESYGNTIVVFAMILKILLISSRLYAVILLLAATKPVRREMLFIKNFGVLRIKYLCL